MTVLPRRRRADLAETLRRRIVSAVSAGLARRGDRLPSAREVAAELDADPRLVLAAYRILSREGLVSIRRRSGIYVAANQEVAGGPPVVAQGWLVETLATGLEQGVSAPKLGEWLRRCIATRRLRVAVVAGSDDQLEMLCGELRDDFGLDAVPFAPDAIDRPGGAPTEMLVADLVAAPEPYAAALRKALPASKRVISIELRSDLDAVWSRETQKGMVYFVMSDSRSVPILERMVAGHTVVQPLVIGRDDLGLIPSGAAVYVTRAARRRLDGIAVPGRLIPFTRAITPRTARELLAVVVEANLAAMHS